jgi:hypothetical protein
MAHSGCRVYVTTTQEAFPPHAAGERTKFPLPNLLERERRMLGQASSTTGAPAIDMQGTWMPSAPPDQLRYTGSGNPAFGYRGQTLWRDKQRTDDFRRPLSYFSAAGAEWRAGGTWQFDSLDSAAAPPTTFFVRSGRFGHAHSGVHEQRPRLGASL